MTLDLTLRIQVGFKENSEDDGNDGEWSQCERWDKENKGEDFRVDACDRKSFLPLSIHAQLIYFPSTVTKDDLLDDSIKLA